MNTMMGGREGGWERERKKEEDIKKKKRGRGKEGEIKEGRK